MPKLDNYERDVDAQIGDRIRSRRSELGMSQAELAERIGMSFQQVQKYERGSNRIASSILLRVSEALDCSPGYFLEIAKKKRGKVAKPAESAADREISVFLQRFRQIKSAKARNRIMLVLGALLQEIERPTSAVRAKVSSARRAPAKKPPPAKRTAKRAPRLRSSAR